MREDGVHEIGSSRRPDWPLAVVVGAGGMGMAAARRLAQRHRVLVADLDPGRAEGAAAALRTEGGDATGVACDVTRAADVDRLAATVDDMGGFRVLAHVAGLSPSMGDFRSIMRVNLLGAALVAEALRPRASVGAAAILISSLAAHNFTPPEPIAALLRGADDPALAETLAAELGEADATPQRAYVLSKWGLMAYCRRQAAAWGERGARIVSLSPGMIATPMGAREFEQSPTKRSLFERTPLRREGTMLEIADAIEFLASDRASFISGTDLLVDGGLAAALAER
jgi:NAD(P)-dependent dehydrogenase (short-subunit alcohol dehydrogenase family)